MSDLRFEHRTFWAVVYTLTTEPPQWACVEPTSSNAMQTQLSDCTGSVCVGWVSCGI